MATRRETWRSTSFAPIDSSTAIPVGQHANEQPSESRTFAMVEICVLMVGFAMSGSAMSNAQHWRKASNAQVLVGLAVYLALGLSFSGPIMVSWRERLGKRRLIWGVGESVWFAFGLPVQIVLVSFLIGRSCGDVWAAISFVVLLILLPFVYLTGNPRIEWTRAPFSWSNVVGLLSVVLWVAALFTAVVGIG